MVWVRDNFPEGTEETDENLRINGHLAEIQTRRLKLEALL
jgi:hypothetical protein